MIKLLSCGYNFVHEDGIVINRPNGSGNYGFVLFKSNAELALQGKPSRVEKNTYILLGPHTPHMYRHLDKPFVNDWFHCTGEGVGSFLTRIGFPLDTPVPARDPFLISRSIMELNHLIRRESPHRDRIIDCDLQSLFMKLEDLRNQTAGLERTSRFFLPLSKLRNGLYSSPNAAYSVEKLASSVNLSKSYFQHIYKELFGCSVITDLIHARMEYAKYLLNNSTLSVAEVAKMCGYENDTHFMRQFRKFVGATPSQYKKRAEGPYGDLPL